MQKNLLLFFSILRLNSAFLFVRKAYQKTASVVNLAEKKKKKLDELSLEELKKIEPKLTNDVLKVFDLKNSVNSKKSYGGTAFDNIKKMIMKYKKQKWLKKLALFFWFVAC